MTTAIGADEEASRWQVGMSEFAERARRWFFDVGPCRLGPTPIESRRLALCIHRIVTCSLQSVVAIRNRVSRRQ